MTPEQARLVMDSWDKVAPIADLAADLFYGRLFELDPGLRPLFAPIRAGAARRPRGRRRRAMVRSLDSLALDLGAASGSAAAQGEAGGRFLDRIQEDFARGAARRAMEDLFSGLLLLRSLASPDRWRRFAREEAIAHPLRRLVHQDPMSRRSFEKPRGYPGDAPLLDYIYRIQRPSEADGPSGECELSTTKVFTSA